MEDYRNCSSGGFNFVNCSRNFALAKDGFGLPEPQKTGTTLCGIVFKDGVVMGGDTRGTAGRMVVEKNAWKVRRLAKSIYGCSAGIAGDAEKLTVMVVAQLELLTLETNRDPLTVTACRIIKQHLFRYKGYIRSNFLVGGVDRNGAHIHSIHPCGSSDTVPYAALGSGSIAAMGVCESSWKPQMDERSAIQLVRDAINRGNLNDLASGSNIDLCVIRRNCTEFYRTYERTQQKGQRMLALTITKGATNLLKSISEKFHITEEVREVASSEESSSNWSFF